MKNLIAEELRECLDLIEKNIDDVVVLIGDIKLRTNYILGSCRGEKEMRAEAQEILDLVKRIEFLIGDDRGEK